MSATPVVEHDLRITRRQRGPLGFVHQMICSCGAASPECVDRSVAIIARRAHLVDIGWRGDE